MESSTRPRLKLSAWQPTEQDLQSAILQALRVHPKVGWACRINSGAAVAEHKGKRRYVRFHTMPGMSDIILQFKKTGRFGAIEVKRHGENLTPEQESFLRMVKQHGGVAGVARSLEEAWALLENA